LISAIKRRTKDLVAELNRVDWPDKQKVLNSTYAVLAVSVLVAAYLWGADVLFNWLTSMLMPGR
jgi:preprotein translocase SecE subunit